MIEARHPHAIDGSLPVATAGAAAPERPHDALLREWSKLAPRSEACARVAALTTALLNATGRGLVLDDTDLAGLDLAGFDLRRASLNRACLHRTRLAGANLSEASLVCPGMERTDLSGANLRGAYVHALAAQVCNFSDADLRDLVDATGALFHGCKLTSATFDRAMLAGTTFYQCDLATARFGQAILQGSTFNECILDEADFDGSAVGSVTITKCRMSRTRLARVSGRALVIQRPTASGDLVLEQADLPALRCDGLRGSVLGAGLRAPLGDFLDCMLSSADFASATLDDARFHQCSIERAVLRAAKLDGASFVDCRLPGVVLEGANAENARFVETTMPRADMRRLTARCALFRDCDLGGADLSSAYLYRAVLTGDPPRAMSLFEAKLENANLVQAYVAADLRSANLRSANLTYARLNQSVLEGADLSGVALYEASLVKVDFTESRLRGVRAPFFADRCRGMKEALESTEHDAATRRFVGDLERLLVDLTKKGST